MTIVSENYMHRVMRNSSEFLSRLRFQDAHADLQYFNNPYEEQKALVSALENPLIKLILVLKPRQIGISTANCAYTWKDTYTTPKALRTLVVTDHNRTTNSLYGKFKMFHDKMPKRLKNANPFKFNEQTKLVESLKTGAAIDHLTARGDAEARSYTYQRLIAEEITKWPHPREMWAGIQPTLHKGPELKKVIISTPNGPGDFFHSLVLNGLEAERLGNKSVKLLFSRWADHPTYRMPVPDWWDPDDDEMKLAALHGLDLEQLYWRHETINGVDGIGLDKFRKEYPLTIEDGFMSASGGWFNNTLLATRFAELPNEETGTLKVYREPEMGAEYVIGCDPSWCGGGDFAVGCVFNQFGEQCAVLTHHVGGEEHFARELSSLAAYFNNALIITESNKGGGGSVIIKILMQEDCRLWKTPQDKDWTTSQGSKQEAYAFARQIYNAGWLELNDHQTCQEMMHIREEDGKIEGRDGHHDDHSMAFVLACWGLKSVDQFMGRSYNRTKRERNPRHVDLILEGLR